MKRLAIKKYILLVPFLFFQPKLSSFTIKEDEHSRFMSEKNQINRLIRSIEYNRSKTEFLQSEADYKIFLSNNPFITVK